MKIYKWIIRKNNSKQKKKKKEKRERKKKKKKGGGGGGRWGRMHYPWKHVTFTSSELSELSSDAAAASTFWNKNTLWDNTQTIMYFPMGKWLCCFTVCMCVCVCTACRLLPVQVPAQRLLLQPSSTLGLAWPGDRSKGHVFLSRSLPLSLFVLLSLACLLFVIAPPPPLLTDSSELSELLLEPFFTWGTEHRGCHYRKAAPRNSRLTHQVQTPPAVHGEELTGRQRTVTKRSVNRKTAFIFAVRDLQKKPEHNGTQFRTEQKMTQSRAGHDW